jgi:hypothetical protein
MQLPVMHVFTKHDGKIFHLWGTETMANHVDTVWPSSHNVSAPNETEGHMLIGYAIRRMFL